MSLASFLIVATATTSSVSVGPVPESGAGSSKTYRDAPWAVAFSTDYRVLAPLSGGGAVYRDLGVRRTPHQRFGLGTTLEFPRSRWAFGVEVDVLSGGLTREDWVRTDVAPVGQASGLAVRLVLRKGFALDANSAVEVQVGGGFAGADLRVDGPCLGRDPEGRPRCARIHTYDISAHGYEASVGSAWSIGAVTKLLGIDLVVGAEYTITTLTPELRVPLGARVDGGDTSVVSHALGIKLGIRGGASMVGPTTSTRSSYPRDPLPTPTPSPTPWRR